MVQVEEYYKNVRSDILPLIPPEAGKVLDVGCGAGNTVAWLRSIRNVTWAGGVEIHPDAAAEARCKLDTVYTTGVEDLELPLAEGSLDLILCLDILEHLVDPWMVVKRLYRLLRPGGTLIASLPNVRNKRVVFPLLFKGSWKYRDFGVLDRTHLRFFTRKSAIDMLTSAGFSIDGIEVTGGYTRGTAGKVLKRVLPEVIQSFLIRQYVIRGVKGS
jgi:2-polyprenyl-3-methyl-5-hydroxy-6-metoxy-1,4-benzoquinol methylase